MISRRKLLLGLFPLATAVVCPLQNHGQCSQPPGGQLWRITLRFFKDGDPKLESRTAVLMHHDHRQRIDDFLESLMFTTVRATDPSGHSFDGIVLEVIASVSR